MANRPKPTYMKLLEGNPGKRPLNEHEPIPVKGIPSIPEWLKAFPFAVQEWDREAAILDRMGAITEAEEGLLAIRCYLASQIQQVAMDLEKEGRVAYTQKMDSLGNEVMEAKTNPKAVQLPKLITEYRLHGSLLGLDQPSRAKMVINTGPKSKFDGLINNAKRK
jgi:P27 family predicted phage terminase small subunit